MIIDFRRFKPPLQPVNTGGVDIEVVPSYKYLGVYLDNKLDWSLNTDALYKKGHSRLFFLRKLRSFNICSKMQQWTAPLSPLQDREIQEILRSYSHQAV